MASFANRLNTLIAGKPAKAKMPEQDLQYFRDKIVNAAALKRKTPQAAGSNAQTQVAGKAIASAFKNAKTFGMPGK